MQQKHNNTEPIHPSLDTKREHLSHHISDNPNLSSDSITVTHPTVMSWQSEAAGQYHQTIGHKIPAYPVLYELSGRILEAGMNKREQSTRMPSTHQGVPDSPHLNTCEQQARRIAVIGAGGGQELVTWGTRYANWQFTGVDPSERMLKTAQQRIDQAGIAHRCRLYEGSMDDLPYVHQAMEDRIPVNKGDTERSAEIPSQLSDAHLHRSDRHTSLYDAASCILVLHFLSSEQEQQAMLNKLVDSVKPGAPIVIACLSGMPEEGERNWIMQAWHEHMQDHHISDEDWYRFVDSIGVTSHPPNVQQMERMLHHAGLVDVASYFQTLFTYAWCGRRVLEGEQTL